MIFLSIFAEKNTTNTERCFWDVQKRYRVGSRVVHSMCVLNIDDSGVTED